MAMGSTRRVIRLYYGFQFFFSLLLWAPVFYEYQKRIGLSDAQIFSIQSIYYIVFCFLEIPTGFMADRFGYRSCMRWGALTLVVSHVLPIAFENYKGFLWHFLLVALARSLISGASSAYLYDYLSEHRRSGDFKQIEGSARAYGLIGKVVCWAGIGALMEWHLTLPYSLTAVAAAISLGFALVLPELTRSHPRSKEGIQIGLVWQSFLSSPAMLFIMLQGIAIFVLARIGQFNLFQPILSERSFGLASYGVIMSMMTIFEAIGSAYPSWMRKWASDLNSVFILTLLMAGSLSLIAVTGKIGALVGLSLFSLGMGFSYPIQRQLLNDAIPDSGCRATLLSMESIFDRAACAWAASWTGQYVGHGQTMSFLHISAGFTLLSVLVLYLALRIYPLKYFDNETRVIYDSG